MICVYAAGLDMFTNRRLGVYMLGVLCKTPGKTVSLYSSQLTTDMTIFVLYSQNQDRHQLIWILQKLAGGFMCVHACIHMCMMVLCVNVWEVLRGRAGIGAGQGGVCCLPCLPSPVTVWCDVRSQSVLTPRIILKTHTSPPSANLLSHAQSTAEPAWKCVRAETISG